MPRDLHSAYGCRKDVGKFTLTKSVVKTVTFKDASGNPVKAEKVHFRVDGVSALPIYFTASPTTALASDPTTNNFWVNTGEAIHTIEFQVGEIRFLHNADNTDVYIIAYGYADLTGTTVA